MTKASDTQVGGDHYKAMGDFQPWDVLAHWLTPEEYRGYQKGVAIAYLARERSKGGDQDIRKAVHHLQRLAEEMDAQPLPIIDQPTDGAKCDADGWIQWSGGDRPVPALASVEIRFLDGGTDRTLSGNVRWDHIDSYGDITAYRIINPTT